MKQCTKCLEFKTDKEFRARKDRKQLHSICRSCENGLNLKRYHNKYKSTDKHRKNSYRYTLKKYYNLSEELFNEMYLEQDGRCKICDEKISNPFLEIQEKKQSLDHCHTTNAIRGLLCNACNSAIGMFKERLDLLKKGVEYLESADNRYRNGRARQCNEDTLLCLP